jgi:hypothetical protein
MHSLTVVLVLVGIAALVSAGVPVFVMMPLNASLPFE